MKRSAQNVMRAGAKIVKIEMSGRLAGAEIARSEKRREVVFHCRHSELILIVWSANDLWDHRGENLDL